jgi:hypothetical protein
VGRCDRTASPRAWGYYSVLVGGDILSVFIRKSPGGPILEEKCLKAGSLDHGDGLVVFSPRKLE